MVWTLERERDYLFPTVTVYWEEEISNREKEARFWFRNLGFLTQMHIRGEKTDLSFLFFFKNIIRNGAFEFWGLLWKSLEDWGRREERVTTTTTTIVFSLYISLSLIVFLFKNFNVKLVCLWFYFFKSIWTFFVDF